MTKYQHFQPLQYTLIIRDQVGHKITGTGSIYDLEGTRTLAESVFWVNRRAAFVDIHPYTEGGSYSNTALETVHHTGISVSAREVYEVPTDQAEAPAEVVEAVSPTEVPVEQSPVESLPASPRRSRRGKAKQETS